MRNSYTIELQTIRFTQASKTPNITPNISGNITPNTTPNIRKNDEKRQLLKIC